MFTFKPSKVQPFECSNNNKQQSSVFLYQKDQNDDRWVLKEQICKGLEEFVSQMSTICLNSNHEHPSILSNKGFTVEKTSPLGYSIYSKLPRMKESLLDRMGKYILIGQKIPEETILKYLYQMIQGVDHLHNKGIPHNNIKPTNILLDRDDNIKLSDISSHVKRFEEEDPSPWAENPSFSGSNSLVGSTQDYPAPEIRELLNSSQDKKIKKKELMMNDIWCIGVIIAELCLLTKKVLSESEGYNIADVIYILKDGYNEELGNLVSGMIELEPQKRKTAKEVLQVLEEKFKEKIGSCFPNKGAGPAGGGSVYSIQHLKKELEQMYTGLITFEQDKLFAVTPVQKSLIDERIIKDFVEDMDQKMTSHNLLDLEDIEFELSGCPVNDSEVRTLSTFMGVKLVKLKRILLNLTLTNVGDQGLRELGHIGPNLEKLESLSLSFRWCKEISDKGLKELGRHLGNNITKLKTISFDVRNCDRLTYQGLKEFRMGIQGFLPDLEYLRLRLEGCTQMDDNSVLEAALFVGPKIPNLQTFIVSFASCSKITKTGVQNLFNYLKGVNHQLKHLHLDFTGCQKVISKLDLNAVQALKTSLGYIGKFDLLFV